MSGSEAENIFPSRQDDNAKLYQKNLLNDLSPAPLIFSSSINNIQNRFDQTSYYKGVLSSAFLHLIAVAALLDIFNTKHQTLNEPASFVQLVTLELNSSTLNPANLQQSLAVKGSSDLQLAKRVDKTENLKRDYLSTKQKPAIANIKPANNVAAIKGVGIDAAAKHGELRASYLDGIVSRLERFKQYPQRALQRHLEADVLLSLTLDTKGHAITSRIITSSGFTFFDEEVLSMVKKASPFPVPPAYSDKHVTSFTIPISFKLR